MPARNDRSCLLRSRLERLGKAVLLSAALFLGQDARAQGSVDTIAGYLDNVAESQLNNPTALALGPDGNLFVADTDNNVVQTLRLSDHRLSPFYTIPRPIGLAFDSQEKLLVASESDGTILRIDRYKNVYQTLRPALSAGPMTALAVDRDGKIYIAQRDGVVTRLTPEGTLDGTYRASGSGLHEFRGVTVTDDGILYVSDAAAHVIWKFAGGTNSVFAGILYQSGATQGPLGFGRLNRPHHIAPGLNGSVVIADRGNHQVRVASCDGAVTVLYGKDPAQWYVSPDFGSGQTVNWPGWMDGAALDVAEARDPVGVAVNALGAVFGTEDYYDIVREATGLSYPASCNSGSTTTTTNTPPALALNPSSGYFPNGVTVIVSPTNSQAGFARNVTLHYTMNSLPPTIEDRAVEIGSDGLGKITLDGPVDLAQLRVRAFFDDKVAGPVAAATPTIVPVPILTPDSGYYPMGIDIAITSTNGFPEGTVIYYEIDGATPTKDSPSITPDAQRGFLTWRDPTRDLRSLRVKAFVGPNEGVAVAGKTVAFPGEPQIRGEVGFPQGRHDYQAGIGSFYLLPIVANMSDDQKLQSLQFVVELTPLPGSPNLQKDDLSLIPASTNDFIQVKTASSVAPDSVIKVVRDGVNRVGVSYYGTSGKFNVNEGFATIALLGIQFRAQDDSGNIAQVGGGYTLSVSTVSGTEGGQALLPLKAMPSRTIHFENIPYREGDTFPAYWYNAGDFGNDSVENGDVRNAVFSALGFRRPLPLSDVFAAMDVYRIGVLANVIEYNDAAIILRRSFNLESPNVMRVRNSEGEWVSSKTQSAPLLRNSVRALATKEASAWRRDVTIVGGIVDRVQPIQAVAVPVYMQVGAGAAVSGMQFVADVDPVDGAPPIGQVTFEPNGAIPMPQYYGNNVDGLGVLPTTVFARWDNLPVALTGKVLLGYVRFITGTGMQAGHHYNINFRETGGAAIDGNTGDLTAYLFQSIHGEVWPWIAHAETTRVSDDWKVHFFGSATVPPELDSDVDDDGFTNIEEYLAGTDPTRADWHVKVDNGHVTFRWVGRAGHQYSVEKTDNFTSWNPVTGRIAGQDGFLEYSELTSSGRAQFYRLNVQ